MDGPFFFQIIRNSSSFFIPNSLESKEVSKLPRPWNSSSWNSSLENLARKVSRGSGLVLPSPIPFYSRFSRKNGRDLRDLPLPSVPTLPSLPLPPFLVTLSDSSYADFPPKIEISRGYASLEITRQTIARSLLSFHYQEKKKEGKDFCLSEQFCTNIFDLLTLMQILDTGKELPLCQVRTWQTEQFL